MQPQIGPLPSVRPIIYFVALLELRAFGFRAICHMELNEPDGEGNLQCESHTHTHRLRQQEEVPLEVYPEISDKLGRMPARLNLFVDALNMLLN